MTIPQLREDVEKRFEELFVHKGEDGDDKPEDWAWTIRGSFPIEVEAFIAAELLTAEREATNKEQERCIEILKCAYEKSDHVTIQDLIDDIQGKYQEPWRKKLSTLEREV